VLWRRNKKLSDQPKPTRARRQRRPAYEWLILTLILLVAFLAKALDPTPMQVLRNYTFDNYQRLKPRPYGGEPVRVIDLDDESLKRLGQWPWPRTLFAKLIERLGEDGVASVSFDGFFAEPDGKSPQQIASALSGQDDLRSLVSQLRDLPDNDNVLAQAMKQVPTVLGFSLSETPPNWPMKPKYGVTISGPNPKPFLQHKPGFVTNLPELEAAAAGVGSVNPNSDADGGFRRVPLIVAADKIYASLVAESLRVATGGSTYIVKTAGGSGEINYGQETGVVSVRLGGPQQNWIVPTDGEGAMWLYLTPDVPERYIPAYKVLDGTADPEKLAGNIVLVGTSAAGLQDIRLTALGHMPGVVLHAQAIEQILEQTYLRRPDFAQGAELLALLLFGGFMIVLLPRVGAAWGAAVGGVGVVSGIAASWFAFTQLGWLVEPLFPAASASVLYVVATSLKYLREERQKAHIRGAFSRYLSPDLVEQVAADPDRLKLGGEMREITIMFQDIRGFTTISEQFDAGGLAKFINGFLTPMTGIVLKNRGTIDKYIGDCIMALWNAPLDDTTHAVNACRCALEMRDVNYGPLAEKIKGEAEAEGRKYLPIKIGIGLNTGVCCVGNLGSEQRFDYSVLGDDVNLASRIEGQTKYYGVILAISDKTKQMAPDFATLELDLLTVKGKTEPVRIHTLVGDEEFAKRSEFKAAEEIHDATIAAYRGQRWDEAEKLCDEANTACDRMGMPMPGFYNLIKERIEEFRVNSPPADWDGVFVATEK
jgi:adenylate cyclase